EPPGPCHRISRPRANESPFQPATLPRAARKHAEDGNVPSTLRPSARMLGDKDAAERGLCRLAPELVRCTQHGTGARCCAACSAPLSRTPPEH
ncbi:MAG: hypothetical protein ACPIOQ_52190, partial [Promethearchaeia archaeon]